jgi:hypothetical protein
LLIPWLMDARTSKGTTSATRERVPRNQEGTTMEAASRSLAGMNNGILENWNGSWVNLVGKNSSGSGYYMASMNQSPNTILLTLWQNVTPGNQGQLSISYGANNVPSANTQANPGVSSPQGIFLNYGGDNVNVSNQNTTAQSPSIYTSLAGPGVPGLSLNPLTIGNSVSLLPYQAAQGNLPTSQATITLTAAPNGSATLFAIYLAGKPFLISTPSGSQGGTILLNMQSNPGVIQNLSTTSFSTITSSQTSWSTSGNYFGQSLWVANLSPVGSGSQAATVLIQQM